MIRLQLANYGPRLKLFVLLVSCMVPSILLFAQAQQKTGKVTDENGKPIPGVSVTIKSTTGGTSTNDDGVFTLNVAAGSTLILSSLNFETVELAVGAEKNYTVSMRSKPGILTDVIVVGYGSQKRTNLTGAVATIDAKKIQNRPVTNAIAALQGLAPGVTVTRANGEPGREGFDIQIRGASSVNGSAALVLIDGVPGNLGGVNPNDIESVSVLKDAAAAAIYGARAAGGVVLVTTKSGKAGKTVVTYNGKFGTQVPINIPGRLHSWEEAEMLNEARTNAGQAIGYTAEQIGWMKDPNINYVVNPNNPNDYLYFDDLNQNDLVLRKHTPLMDHNISLRGGGEKDNYFLSVGYFDQKGIFKLGPDKTDRINVRFNYSNQINRILSFDTRLSYRQSNILAPSTGHARVFSNLYTTRTLYPTFFPNTTDRYINDNSGNFAYALLKDGGSSNSRTDDASAQFALKAKDIIKGLTLSATYSPRLSSERQRIATRSIARYNILGVAGFMNNPNSYAKNNLQLLSNSVQMLADYTFKKGENHDFHLLGGYAYESQRLDTTFALAKNLASNDFFSLVTGDPVQTSSNEGIQEWGLESYFGRFNYAFKNRYLFEANLRYDGSSRLASANRWYAFPSVSVGWRLGEEEWFSSLLPIFEEFKLRGSWGRLGNSEGGQGGLGNYDYQALLTPGSAYPFNNVRNRSYYQAFLASPDKVWETIETTNIGMDLILLDKRLNFTADYFTKRNNNMLVPISLSSIIGVGTTSYNLATLKTWGWEISAGWRDNLNKNFAYWINANLGDNKNEIIKYRGQRLIEAKVNKIIEGYAMNTLFGYQANGYYKDAADAAGSPKISTAVGAGDIKFVDINKDGKINVGSSNVADHGDLVNLGTIDPRYTYGFDFGFSYKGFDFSAMFQGVGQRKLFLEPSTMYPYISSWLMPMDYNRDYWTPTNTDAKFPRLYVGGAQNTVSSSHWLMNAAYLRLKNVQIGYNLPTALVKKAGITNAKLYVSGQDLWEVSNMWLKDVFDPEMPNAGTWQYPFFRTVTVGVNLSF